MADATDRSDRETPTVVTPGPAVYAPGSYEGIVRSTLMRFGSPNPDADLIQTKDYWRHCQSVRIAPEVCGALIYETVRHRHDQTVMLRERSGAAENVGLMEPGVSGLSGEARQLLGAIQILAQTNRGAPVLIRHLRESLDFSPQEFDKALSELAAAGRVSLMHDDLARGRPSNEQAMLYWSNGTGYNAVFPAKTAGAGGAAGASGVSESSAQAPTHGGEEWEVRVRRHKGYSINKMVGAVGRKPDEITADTIIWGDFRDDDRAKEFARKLTTAGFITTYGPRAKALAAENSGASDRVGFHWVDVSFAQKADAEKFSKLVDKQSGRIGSFVGGTQHGAIVTTNASHSTITKVLKKHRWAGAYSVPAEAAECAGDPSAMESIEAVAEPPIASGSVPWVKVTRDVDRYSAAIKTADKIGPIKGPRQVYDLLGDALNKEDQEVFCVILLDLRGNLRGVCEVARGQRSRVTVGVADVLRPVVASGAEGYIVVHNHPSGKCSPSKADRDLTRLIAEATKPYGKDVCFIDHVVIGIGECFSICENKCIKM